MYTKTQNRKGGGSDGKREFQRRSICISGDDVCVQMSPAVWPGVNSDEL